MRYLGIDYGKKRVGVAISDENGEFALPLLVLASDAGLMVALKKIIVEKEIGAVVLGESKNFKGESNPIMVEINRCKRQLEIETGLPVYYEPEFMTSAAADRMNDRDVGQSRKSGLKLRSPKVKNEMLDASAAAIILQSYLDKIK